MPQGGLTVTSSSSSSSRDNAKRAALQVRTYLSSVFIVTCLVASLLAGCATIRGPRQINGELGGATPPEWNWSRVGELAPAAEVMVTAKGSQPASRYFVSADELALTVLNLTDPTLPTASTRVLRDMASRHPEYFATMQQGATFGEGDVRVGRDGVFVADRKVADLGQILESIARDNVAEITGPVVARGSVLGAALGGWVGFAVGVVPGLGGASKVVTWSVVVGSVAVGGYLGFHWSSHQTEGLIYRAP
jgi:hypothetical protein